MKGLENAETCHERAGILDGVRDLLKKVPECQIHRHQNEEKQGAHSNGGDGCDVSSKSGEDLALDSEVLGAIC